MTPEQSLLLERLHALLTDEPAVREVAMFGGRSIMVNEKMVAAVRKDGALLVHADPERHDELLTRPGTRHAFMGRGRMMGPGWIEVDANTVSDNAPLIAWLDLAMEHNRALTGDCL